MAKSVAIILDGGFVLKKMPKPTPNAGEIYNFALSCIGPGEELFRIFFYHCLPYDQKELHPISGEEIDFRNSPPAKYSMQLFSQLSEMNYVAIRKGRLVFRGWKVKKYTMSRLQQHSVTVQQTAATSQSTPPEQSIQQLTANDFAPEFTQKEVDIKIGLDVAWLSSRRLIDKIILVSGDTDLVPAMKFARREGVQVVVVDITKTERSENYLKGQIKEHADEIRTIRYSDSAQNWTIV